MRDRRTVMILFGMPIVMMLLFGFAISTDVKNVRTVVVTSQTDSETQHMVQRLDASEYFDITHTAATPQEAEALIRARRADMAVVFAPNMGSNRYSGQAMAQIITDGADPNTSVTQVNYARQVLAEGTSAHGIEILTKMLYNPQMRSAYNFVPGIMGLLLMIICAMMTSVSIVREKERGTMEVLLVSPVKPLMVMVAKAVPYMVLSVVIMCCIIAMAVYVLDVPVAGSLTWVAAVTMLYILMALSLGLLISVVAKTQLVAMLASAMMLLLPSLLLSGMIYPTESMPDILQYISLIVPARWYIAAMRKLMIMGTDINAVTTETTVLAAMTLVMLALALKKFKNRLE